MRGLRAAVATTVLSLAVPASAAGQHGSHTANPCRWAWSAPEGPGTDPDLDITHVGFHLSKKALAVAIRVRALSAGAPQDGDHFVVSWESDDTISGRSTYQSFRMGGWRSPSAGTHPDSDYGALRGATISYDAARSVVTLRLPRKALYAQMEYYEPEPTFRNGTVYSDHHGDGAGGDANAGDEVDREHQRHAFAACDAALGYHPKPVTPDPRVVHVAFPGPCATVVMDPVGDDDSGSAATSRPDLDITHVRYQMSARSITTTIRIHDIASHPAGYWRQNIYVMIGWEDDGDEPPNSEQGIYRETTGGGYIGSPPKAVIDDARGLATITVRRNENTDAYGLAAFTSDGESYPTSVSISRFLTADCDRKLAS
jgi:hypothetical protein